MTFTEYQSIAAINATSIKAGRLSMAHMHQAMTGPNIDKPAYGFGRLVHTAILEPANLLTSCSLWEGAVKRGKEWDAWRAEHPNCEPVSTEQMGALRYITDAVRANADVSRLLAGCEYERTLTWEGTYGHGKGRLDAIGDNRIIDVKTCGDISERGRDGSLFRYGYDVQMGWYAHGSEMTKRCSRPDLFILWVESTAPFTLAIDQLGYDVIERGQREAILIASEYSSCCKAGVWPGPQSGVRVVNLPVWLADEAAGVDISTEVVNG